MPAAARTADRESVEHWLRAYGVPNFVVGYGAARRVLPRAFWTAVVAAAVIAMLVALGGGGVLGAVAGAIGGFAGGLVVGYVVLASGLIPISLFGVRWLTRTIARGSGTLVSVLPLLLVAITFLFLGAETWQSVGRLRGTPLVLTTMLFVALGISFVWRQVRPDLDAVATFSTPDDLRTALPTTLTWPDELVINGCHADTAELRRGERMNLRATTAVAQVTVAAVVGLVVFAFFIVFGVLVVGVDTVKSWSTADAQIWWQATIAGHHYALTAQHVRVSAFLGVFSAFYFVVSSSSDRSLRDVLSEGARKHAQTCLAVRAVYRHMV